MEALYLMRTHTLPQFFRYEYIGFIPLVSCGTSNLLGDSDSIDCTLLPKLTRHRAAIFRKREPRPRGIKTGTHAQRGVGISLWFMGPLNTELWNFSNH